MANAIVNLFIKNLVLFVPRSARQGVSFNRAWADNCTRLPEALVCRVIRISYAHADRERLTYSCITLKLPVFG